MYVTGIKLINFRNYKELELKINDKLNIFLGNNAQGKTNLLESVFIAATGKSYRTNRDKELIHLEKNAGYISIELEKNNRKKKIEIRLDKEKPKRVKVNRIELDKISDLIGVLNVVMFSPEDLKLVKGGPSERRSFLDSEISQIKPKYRYNLSRYNKILIQRNNLLKIMQHDRNKGKIMEVWDSQMSEIGSDIIRTRMDFIERISQASRRIHEKITGGLEELTLNYLSSLNITQEMSQFDIKERFLNELKGHLEKDIERGATEFGPHRDDIKIMINDIDSRIFGSQGQQRTAALSLKLAEVHIIKDETGEYPVLLLDDVLSELDQSRRQYLLSTFKQVQTIITSTDDIQMDEIIEKNKNVFHIKAGSVLLDSGGI